MTLPWLADVLRSAGLTVVEHPDWKTHDRSGDWTPRFGVVHATAAPISQADSTQIRVVRDGRSDLPGPIANAVIDRKGVWHVVGGGRCNSTLVGTAGPFEGLGNTYALSTEGCNNNSTESWPDVQYTAYVRGWAAWCKRLGWTAAKLVGHKEHTPGHKTDPTFNMDRFRQDVTRVLAGGSLPQEDEMSETAESEIHSVFTGFFFGGSSMGRTVDPDGAGTTKASNSLVAKLDFLMLVVEKLAVTAGIDASELTQLRTAAREGALQAGQELATTLTTTLVAAVKDAVGDQLSADDLARVEATVRGVFEGGLVLRPDAE